MATRVETAMVTGKINGQSVTVPAGTTILEAARLGGIDVPNLCFQPGLRAWGSCRICTVEILGKRGGLIESCATPLGEGMEVLTHSEPVEDARQFIMQMYLIDHALDCPTCDKSGECYLQDNTYLQNVTANPYRRPKFATSYVHFSDLIDYKADRCIMCNRCTRICDEVVGVTAIESAFRSLEATITPAFGDDLSDTLCTSCGLCIAVCPVGALTDRHFAHHPWELDTTETICGFCDVGCTINVETSKGIVRRTTNLWERGVNHGYTCYYGKWGHESVQSPDRIPYPTVRETSGITYETTWEDVVASLAPALRQYQGNEFAALVSQDSTNEEIYALAEFTRSVMKSNSIDRMLSFSQAAVERGVRSTLGANVANTNNMEELFTDIKSALVIGPDLGKTAPVASYGFYHARIYRETKLVVISQDDFPLGWRGDLWIKPNPGTLATLLDGIAASIVKSGLAVEGPSDDEAFTAWSKSLSKVSLAKVAEETGVPVESIETAASIYASGGSGKTDRPAEGFPPSLIYQTEAHQASYDDLSDGDPEAITVRCNYLALLTGNLGRAGGGVASPRGSANAQGASDMGANPDWKIDNATEARWATRWDGQMDYDTALPVKAGFSQEELVSAIEAGQVKAMIVEDSIAGRERPIDSRLYAALSKLELLVVLSPFKSPLTSIAHIVLPKAMAMEVDGTFTSFDRTVQRVRAAVPPSGEAKSSVATAQMLAASMGYNMPYRHPADVMDEIAAALPDYAGVTYARLERDGVTVPVASFLENGQEVLGIDERTGKMVTGLVASAAD